MSSVKRILRTVAITGAIAALISGTLSSPASAANVVDCGDRTDVVHIWAHAAHHQDDRYELCAANAGFVGYQYWTDEFYTGNNRVTIHDMNGATFTLEKWTDYHPTNAFALDYFIIL